MKGINGDVSFLDKIEQIQESSKGINTSWEQGFTEARKIRKDSPKYMKKLKEAASFIGDIKKGKYGSASSYFFKEAMTTSDFPKYFGDILDRSVLAAYQAAEVQWRQLSQVGTVNDFREKGIFDFSGPDAHLNEIISEKGEYPNSKMEESELKYRVWKRGRTFDISWETIINDNLDIFDRIPEYFATAAIRTEERFHTNLYASSSGPNSDLFIEPDSGVINGNLGKGVLNVNNLGIAIASMGMMVDENNEEPIWNRPSYLVVPPALELTARRILNSTNLVWQVVEGTQSDEDVKNRPFPTENFLEDDLTLVVNPYLPVIDTTRGHTAWYLFAAPGDTPATEVGFLSGYEEPQIFIKQSDQVPVGGEASPMNGDFHSDNIKYKVRHILGGTQVKPAKTGEHGSVAAYASTGEQDTIDKWPDNNTVDEPQA